MALFACATAVLAAAPHINLETTAESMLDKAASEYRFYEESKALFGGDEFLVAVIGPRDAQSGVVEDTSALLASVPAVRRVDSPSTLDIVNVLEDGALDFRPALDGDRESWTVSVGRMARDRVYPQHLLGDGDYVAINALLEADTTEFDEFITSAEAAIPNSFTIAGVPRFRVEVSRATNRDLARLFPAVLILMGLIAGITFRSARAAISVLIPGLCGVAGIAVASGLGSVPISMLGMALPPVMIAMGVAYSAHMISLSASQGARSALKEVRLPTLLSGSTTALGFLALLASPIPAIQHVAVLGASGTAGVTLGTLVFLPVALGDAKSSPAPLLSAASRFLSRMPRGKTVAIWIALLALAAVGISRASVSTDVTEWFDLGHPVRDDYELVKARFSGTSPINLVISSSVDQHTNLLTAEMMARLDDFGRSLESMDTVGKVISIADPILQLHGAFVSGDEKDIGLQDAAIPQYALLLESVPAFSDLVNPNRDHLNVVVRLDAGASTEMLETADTARRWWQEYGISGTSLTPTGIMYEFARSEDALALGAVRGVAWASVAIFVLALLALRSLRSAILVTWVSGVPIMIVIGAAGFAGVPLDAGNALLGSMAMGIAVDDSIHLAVGYTRRKASSASPRDAIDATFYDLGPAVVFSTACIAVAFAILSLSELSLTAGLGGITVITVLACLGADLTLLPALLRSRK